jgi:hypothetical protein
LAYSIVPIAGLGENIWSVCQEPPKFFVGGAFDDGQDFRVVRHAFHEGMQMDLAPAAGEGELLGRCDVLTADRDHQIIQQRSADFSQHLGRHIG